MSYVFYYHPLASFCHKVLVALYEREVPFEARYVDLADEASSKELFEFWPVGKIPVLRDEHEKQTVPETTIMVEYLDQHFTAAPPMLPADPGARLQARLWDRFFDNYVQVPMQKVVVDRLRPPGRGDAHGVDEAIATLKVAYGMLERQLRTDRFCVGADFTLADCAAAPALFYAHTIVPFGTAHPKLAAYFDRLCARPSFVRVLDEARPYFKNYPLYDQIPARFLR